MLLLVVSIFQSVRDWLEVGDKQELESVTFNPIIPKFNMFGEEMAEAASEWTEKACRLRMVDHGLGTAAYIPFLQCDRWRQLSLSAQ